MIMTHLLKNKSAFDHGMCTVPSGANITNGHQGTNIITVRPVCFTLVIVPCVLAERCVALRRAHDLANYDPELKHRLSLYC